MDCLPLEVWRRGDGSGISSFLVPVHAFRAGACSKSISEILLSTHWSSLLSFKREEWVYIDDLANTSYNGRLGQIFGTVRSQGGQTKRCAVVVDGLPRGEKCAVLPAKHLVKVHPTVHAVRLHAEGEDNQSMPGATYIQYVGGRRAEYDSASYVTNLVVSEVYLPAGLTRFCGGLGDCTVMCRVGIPLALSEVVERRRLPGCEADIDNGKLPCGMAYQLLDLEGTEGIGPQVVSTVDGTDLSINDLVMWDSLPCPTRVRGTMCSSKGLRRQSLGD